MDTGADSDIAGTASGAGSNTTTGAVRGGGVTEGSIGSLHRTMCVEPGSPRRPGGLGDFLAGSLAVVLSWSSRRFPIAKGKGAGTGAGTGAGAAAGTMAAESKVGKVPAASTTAEVSALRDSDALLACQAACTLVRRACLGAYQRKKRAMVAPDVLDEMAVTFEELSPANGASQWYEEL